MTFYQRLLRERDELGERIYKLSGYIGTSAFYLIDQAQQDLLKDQLPAMVAYGNILQKRIETLGPQDEQVGIQPQLTEGEKAVGITFNPGGKPEVEALKLKCADVIDEIHTQMNSGKANGEQIAQFTLAKRSIQVGQMWAVKAATWQY